MSISAPSTRSRFRAWHPTLKAQRAAALLLLVLQGGITVTGSFVRVTGSGLGCNTWPNCHEGSLIPVEGAAPIVQQFIEFGNRMLTFVLVAAAVAVLVLVIKAQRRRELVVYSVISLAGIVLQAVIGGISVLLDLQWWAVALHFLPSMILVWVAAILFQRITQPDDGQPQKLFSPLLRGAIVVATVALSIVLVTGTMTTGAGPHSGDDGIGMEGRLEVDIDWMAHIHGWLMYVYLFATVVTVAILYRQHADRAAKRNGWALIAFILIQAAIGIAQYRMGVPRWTVPIHIGMSSVVTALSALLFARGRAYIGGTATLTGNPEHDKALTDRPLAS